MTLIRRAVWKNTLRFQGRSLLDVRQYYLVRVKSTYKATFSTVRSDRAILMKIDLLKKRYIFQKGTVFKNSCRPNISTMAI